MNTNETSFSGKELAKINKRKAFYNKFERQLKASLSKNQGDFFFPLSFQNKTSFPAFDDLNLLLRDFSEDLKNLKEESKDQVISLPNIDEGIFLLNQAKDGVIKIFKEETFVNDDGSIRKGSTGSLGNYNYQSAYCYYIQVVNYDALLHTIEKEKEDPTIYEIKVKTKKIQQSKKYLKTYRYPRRFKR